MPSNSTERTAVDVDRIIEVTPHILEEHAEEWLEMILREYVSALEFESFTCDSTIQSSVVSVRRRWCYCKVLYIPRNF